MGRGFFCFILYRYWVFILYLVIGQDFHKSRMFKAKEIEGELKYAVRRQEETIYHKRPEDGQSGDGAVQGSDPV